MEMPDLPETPTSDIPTGANNQPWDCTTTGVEMVEKPVASANHGKPSVPAYKGGIRHAFSRNCRHKSAGKEKLTR
ncbi:Uncharacterised protein [Escherichia coli]|uniref:Uncharacterized protein n=1 Tax=Escherichia coli TaxID=562 RepID=A0A2X1NDG0_ECOLX|nr:Uncharacterised protein [Escherichia coli]